MQVDNKISGRLVFSFAPLTNPGLGIGRVWGVQYAFGNYYTLREPEAPTGPSLQGWIDHAITWKSTIVIAPTATDEERAMIWMKLLTSTDVP